MKASSRIAAALAVVTTVTTGGIALSLLPGAGPAAAATELAPYDDCGQLLTAYRAQLVKQATPYGLSPRGVGGFGFEAATPTGSAAAAGPMARDTAGAVGSSATGTNVQEAGVDEPDIAKLAGGVLLVAAGSTVQLVKPGPTPRVLSVVSLAKESGTAQLLVAGTRVLALSHSYARWGPAGAVGSPAGAAASPARSPDPRTLATLIDISEPTKPRILETTTTDGNLVSARLSDGRVRLVSSSSPRLPVGSFPKGNSPADLASALLANQLAAQEVTLDQLLPQTERRNGAGVVLARGPAVACKDVRHPRGVGGTRTLTVTSLDLAQSLAPTGSTAINADGDTAYMSRSTLYVATSRWSAPGPVAGGPAAGVSPVPSEVTTQLHAFSLQGPTATYRASGSVPGYLLSNYSLSEHKDHLRVATTRQPPWSSSGLSNSASVVVLKDDGKGALVQTGRLDGLGKGERIFAVRFLGDLATVVTFRQTDPLYTLDLADPSAPKVLGELKIPGFSNYLHPIGTATLVGVGQDANEQGRTTGLQLATFDLTDLTAPRRTRTLSLGVGYSQAANDPHAFSFSPEQGLVTIPMSDQHGATYLVGARASATELVEVGRLASPAGTHLIRSLVVGGLLMAVSDTGVTAADVQTMAATGSVRFAL